ncbi:MULTISPECIES: toprim domain-containing protein [Kaistella]|uniref:toprim domain-containing protein n=1 Tax=Kaistella TaxID=2782231 RepID=UPI0025B58525|nr:MULTISPECIES: toprim domain-containing protein [Kaistella]MDN3606335.1 toprim domain-containing protein [Kaistella yonginensis]MDP2453488.1 toprim domain-containing protein [Kaistella sp. SH11-4b]MDP2456545.1 toprim domain-containing protein [Kaistella sp. SH40-3]MDP2459301.1 toprim domain-containing protein [Kaistella sp. SH19-2b]
MNCSEAKNISIKAVLESFSFFPSKENSRTAFYFALDREEKTPSLSVDFIKNTAFDFGTGKSYDSISIVQAVKKCSVSDALKYLEQFNFSFQKQNLKLENLPKGYEIIDVKEIQHPALIHYLKSRNVEDQKKWVEEIHYRMNDKNYFGIGFKNDSGGYEIRNAYSKICLDKKDITSIKNDSKDVRIFEGFFDFLSFKKVENYLEKETSDYIILNSVSMIHKIKNEIGNYKNIELYFDNDEAGTRAVEIIKNDLKNAEDCRVLYSDFKDLNDWLLQNNPTEERQVKYRRR